MAYAEIIYLIAVGISGCTLVWWLYIRINATELKRKKYIKRLKTFDAVKTSSPLDDPDKEAQEKGLENIESRFSIMRRAIIPTVVFFIAGLMSVPFLGRMPSTMISVLIAALTIILGIAAKPFVENLISGFVITMSQLIRIGDAVDIDGHYGTVEDISITHTTIKIWDWRRYIVPNARMLNKELVNYSVFDKYRWVGVEFWIDYDSDIELVRELAVEAARKSRYNAEHEPPRLWVIDMAKEGIRCMVVAWANAPFEGWMLGVETRTELIKSFQKHSIMTHGYHLKAPVEMRNPQGVS